MVYRILFTNDSKKQFSKLSKDVQSRIVKYLDNRVKDNPFLFGKNLVGDKKGLWRYRVDDYRILCAINNEELVVLIVEVGHRKNIYK
jgi:mRNA interferase RelE/StbE